MEGEAVPPVLLFSSDSHIPPFIGAVGRCRETTRREENAVSDFISGVLLIQNRNMFLIVLSRDNNLNGL